MIGISENNLNKTEKNKLIKKISCNFTFKNKWKKKETSNKIKK